jgi:MFS family permease
LGAAAFLPAETQDADAALIPLRLFRGRTFGLGSLLNFILGMGMFGGLAALPLYLQIVKGVSPTKAGLLLIPLTVGIMAGSIVSGQIISRTERYKKFPVIGAGLLVLALAGLGQIGVGTPLWPTMLLASVFGIGLGFSMQPLTLAVQNAVPPQDMGVATSSATFFRQMGGTLGTAVFLSVLFSTVGDRIAAAFRTDAATPAFQAALRDPQVLADPTNKRVVDAITSGGGLPKGALDDTSFLSRLDDRLARPFLQGFTSSMDLVFTSAAVVVLVAFVVVFFLPEERLRTVSGIEARRQDAAAAALPRQDAAGRAAAVSAPSSQSVDGASLDEAGLGEPDLGGLRR